MSDKNNSHLCHRTMKSGNFWKFPFRCSWKEMDKGRFIFYEVRFLGIWLIDWDIRPFWYFLELSRP